MRLGLTNGLQLALDVGDNLSYSGSGDKWLDGSGNGYDFFRGADGTTDGTEPTFNGTPGKRSNGEYWSFDGGDFFTYDFANETWMNNLHKNNAVFSIVAWCYFGSLASLHGVCGTTSAASIRGTALFTTATPNLRIFISSGDGSAELDVSALTPTVGEWQMVGVSLDESAGADGGFLFHNGATSLFNSTYSSPSASDAPNTFAIADCRAGNVVPLPNGSRIAMFAAWEGVKLSESQMTALFNATRKRFNV